MRLTKTEAVSGGWAETLGQVLAERNGFTDSAALRAAAGECCRSLYGDQVFVRGLIEASNSCRLDCLYCGIGRTHRQLHRYSLDDDTILQAVRAAFARGVRSFVIQGAEDPAFGSDRLARLAVLLRAATDSDIALTYSFGTMARPDYARLRDAGVNRYLLRFETADPVLHQHLRGSPLERRLQALHDLRELGFELGSGFMTGLPGSSVETELANIELCKSLALDMVGIGPFIPHPATALAGSECRGVEPAIDACAAVRLALPLANIPATTAAGSLAADGRERMLAAGANVLMPNIGPVASKKDYELYPGKICLDEDGLSCLSCLALRVRTVDRRLVLARGDSLSAVARQAGRS